MKDNRDKQIGAACGLDMGFDRLCGKSAVL